MGYMNHNDKQAKRLRRAKRTRMHVREMQVKNPNLVMLTVHKSNKHLYVAAIAYEAYTGQSRVLAAASTVEKQLREECEHKTNNQAAAQKVGVLIAKRLLELNLPDLKVAFDRSGYQYHGRVKTLAEAAREQGLEF